MSIAFDNTFLTLMINPGVPARPNPATNRPTPNLDLRIEALLDDLSKRRTQVLIPAPAYAEALTVTGDLAKVQAVLGGIATVALVPFDGKAAIEYGMMMRAAKEGGDKRGGAVGDWQRIKFDRQIVAVAVAHGASVLYTDDDNQTKFAELAGLVVKHTWDLELPDRYAQMDILRDEKTEA